MSDSNIEKSQDIEISELVNVIKPYLLIIVIFSMGIGALSFLYTKLFVTPTYESKSTLIINNRRNDGNTSISNDEINSAKGLANVYSIVIKSDSVLQPVVDRLNLPMTPAELSKKVKVTPVNNTQVIEISVRDKNKKSATEINKSILEVAPNVIVETVEAGSVKTVSQPSIPQKPVSPNVMRTALFAFVSTFIVCEVLVIIRYLLDKTFKKVDDLETMLDLPVLGVIPDISTLERK